MLDYKLLVENAKKYSKKKAINLAFHYFINFKGGDKEKYIRNVQSFVTVFLFQPPMITSSKEEERKEINRFMIEIYGNPIEYVKIFDRKLRENFQ